MATDPVNSSTPVSSTTTCTPELGPVMALLKQIADQLSALTDSLETIETRLVDLERPY